MTSKRKNAEELVKKALEPTAFEPTAFTDEPLPGMHFDDIVRLTRLSKAGASKALKRLHDRREVLAYVVGGEYPKLSYKLRNPPVGYAQDMRKFLLKHRKLLNILATNRQYAELHRRSASLQEVKGALISLEVVSTVRLGLLFGRSQQVIIEKLAHKIQTFNDDLDEDYESAGIHWPRLSLDRARNFVHELFEQGLIKIEPCVLAVPTSDKVVDQLEAEGKACADEMGRIHEQVAEQLRKQKRKL